MLIFTLYIPKFEETYTEMSTILENWNRVKEQVAETAIRAGRKPSDIQIVAVSKTQPVEILKEAVGAGVQILGENRIQEAWQKYQEVGNIASWHLVGHLQTNKVKRALEIFDVIHSVDSQRLAEELHRRCIQKNQTITILVEVKTSDEPTKYGIEPEKTIELVETIAQLPRLRLIGLMTLGKWTTNEIEVKNCFRTLKKTRDHIENQNISGISLPHLSMGMSGDFRWAIEEGATIVRIGTAIFGARN